jgi:LysM repeat protein
MMEFPMSRNWVAIRVWLLVVILITSLAGVPAVAQGMATVRVEPAALAAQLNDTVNIAIKVDNIANLIAFELHLAFNPGVLEVTGMTNGGFVAADFEAQKIFDNTAGTLDYAVAQMNRPPAQGSGTLLNISFRVKGNGSSTVTTRATQAAPSGLILADQNGMAIQASWVPGTINVGTSITNTPTYTPTWTRTVTPCDDDASCPPPTHTPTLTNTPTYTQTSTAITNTPTNTFTPTHTPALTLTPTNTPTVTPTPHPRTHVVRWGEWLYCIGRAYKVSPWAIAKENGVWWPYMIFPNQKLTIPNVPWMNMTIGPVCKAQFTINTPTPIPTVIPATPVTVIPPTTPPAPATTAPPFTCRATYVVRQGDTLYRIAVQYGTTYNEVARVNGISNPRLIYPGQQLCIP